MRETKARAPKLAFIVPDGVAREDFWMVAGDAAEGTRMTQVMNATRHPAAVDVVADLMARGTDPAGAELYAYAAVQAWAQAVKVVRTTGAARVAQVLRAQQFSTVIGEIGFDKSGDVIGIEPFTWYVWTTAGMYRRTWSNSSWQNKLWPRDGGGRARASAARQPC